MKILWISNVLFPDVNEALGKKNAPSCGWMFSLAKYLLKTDSQLELLVAAPYACNEIKEFHIGGISYYLIPNCGSVTAYHKEQETYWRKVYDSAHPDLVHIHGTEYPHGLAFLNACPEAKVVVSIQGMVSVISRYYRQGLSNWDILRNLTFRDIVRFDTIWQQQKKFAKRGEVEKEVLRKCKHVIGRTSWDRAHSLAINPSVQYHFCNETLRPAFYKHQWSYNECEKHSIFVSQAYYPLKGMHVLIKALPLVIEKFPDTKVCVAGYDMFTSSSLEGKLREKGYISYLKRLMKRLNVQNLFTFTGVLDENQMCERFLKSNVYINPSSIENSPNSVGEAQLLGVPCLASYVGGTPDMMKGVEENLYRFDEYEMLAEKICCIFSQENLDYGNVQQAARDRHDPERNVNRLLQIYNEIINS